MLATGLSYEIAEGRPGHALGPLLVGLLFVRFGSRQGWLVIDVFMGLRWAPVFWRRIVLGWLVAICSLLALVYALAR